MKQAKRGHGRNKKGHLVPGNISLCSKARNHAIKRTEFENIHTEWILQMFENKLLRGIYWST